jgi:hypothetical protein
VTHQHAHFVWTIALLAGSIGAMTVVRNRVIRRRLAFSALTFLAAVALHLTIVERWTLEPTTSVVDSMLVEHGWKIEGLLIAFAIINALVTLAFNPWFRDQTSDRAPAIVQDTLVAALAVIAAMALFQNSALFTSSAIAAAIPRLRASGHAR